MLRIPPPVWALVYTLAAAAVSWGLGWPAGLRIPAIGVPLTFLAWAPAIWAVVLFRRAGTEIRPDSDSNRALLTEGPYRFTRNPMYLGIVASSLGFALWVGAWPMLLVPVAILATVSLVHIPFEEAKMRRQFGSAFDAYAARVRRWV